MAELLLRAGEDDEAWRELVGAIEGSDVYDDPAYAAATAEHIEAGEAWLAAYDGPEGRAFNIIAMRPLSNLAFSGLLGQDLRDKLHDIVTPYGYGGPRLDPRPGRERELREAFKELMVRFCRAHDVVTEFVRFHPSVDPFASWLYEPIGFGRVWFLSLGDSPDRMMARFSAPCRRAIRRAESAGLSARILDPGEHMERFAGLYRDTMKRVGAGEFYFFPDEYFIRLLDLGERLLLIEVDSGERAAAMGLFLVGPNAVHYHLGGSDAELLGLRPNNLLFFRAAVHAKHLGRSWLHLGGGMAGLSLMDDVDDRDGLDRFKAGFGTTAAVFFGARKVWDQDAFDRCVLAFQQWAPCVDVGAVDFFPPYRSSGHGPA